MALWGTLVRPRLTLASALAAVALTAVTQAAYANVSLTQVSSDPFTNSTSYHMTQVEPDSFAFGQTIVAPYSVRRRPHAPVSTPLAWDEVSPRLDPATFNMRTFEKRLARGDPWADFWRRKQALPKKLAG